MIKFAPIVPTAFIGRVPDQKFHLLLAHIVEQDPQYLTRYLQLRLEGHYLLLDNGAYEFGGSVDPNKLLAMARKVCASGVFLPDVRFDMKRTLTGVERALPFFKGSSFDLYGVPQGNDLFTVLDCYSALYSMGIRHFGLYEEIGEVTKVGTRIDFLHQLEMMNLVYPDAYYHMLGAEEDPRILAQYSQFNFVGSLDTAKPFVCGLFEKVYSPNRILKNYPHRPKGYFELTDKEVSLNAYLTGVENICKVIKGLNGGL
jgi:hypothetical protein